MIGLGSDKNQAKPKPKPTQTVSRPDDQLGAKPAKDWLWPGENVLISFPSRWSFSFTLGPLH